MRKRYREKRRSCGLCKPQKRALSPRWSNRQLDGLIRAEREVRSADPSWARDA